MKQAERQNDHQGGCMRSLTAAYKTNALCSNGVIITCFCVLLTINACKYYFTYIAVDVRIKLAPSKRQPYRISCKSALTCALFVCVIWAPPLSAFKKREPGFCLFVFLLGEFIWKYFWPKHRCSKLVINDFHLEYTLSAIWEAMQIYFQETQTTFQTHYPCAN